MATVVEQAEGTRKENRQRIERSYWIKGVTDTDSAMALLTAEMPSTRVFDGRTYSLSFSDMDASEVAAGVWSGTAVWNVLTNTQFESSIDITGETMKLLHSFQTRAKQAATGFNIDDYDFKNAINVDEKNSIGGVDVIAPKACEACSFERAVLDSTYKRKLTRAMGKMNSAAFLGYDAGELLLTRVSASQKFGETAKIQLGFSVTENWVNESVPPFTIAAKRGWDYLWIHYVLKDDGLKGSRVPAAAFIERVFKEYDFNDLEVPGLAS